MQDAGIWDVEGHAAAFYLEHRRLVCGTALEGAEQRAAVGHACSNSDGGSGGDGVALPCRVR